MKKQIILFFQGCGMLAVAAAPALDPGYYDFPLAPMTTYKAFGLGLEIIGIVIVVRGLFFLRQKFTISAQPLRHTVLITDGPFRYTRNPMYFGGLLLSYGWGISLGSVLAVICSTVLLVVLLMKIQIEEAYLRAQFGSSYLAYCRRVKKLIPYVY